jgi:hypothetical protein
MMEKTILITGFSTISILLGIITALLKLIYKNLSAKIDECQTKGMCNHIVETTRAEMNAHREGLEAVMTLRLDHITTTIKQNQVADDRALASLFNKQDEILKELGVLKGQINSGGKKI